MMLSLIARMGFTWVRWKSRRGLDDADGAVVPASKKEQARRVGVRGEAYAYWYLRRHGYVFIARNFTPSRAKGELDLVGYDGETLAIVEVRTRQATLGQHAGPEMSITQGKHEMIVRTAEYFLRERHIDPGPVRFDVIAIDNISGQPPAVRLHKAALSPVTRR